MAAAVSDDSDVDGPSESDVLLQSRKGLDELPINHSSRSHLKKLCLSFNRIRSIPPAISEFRTLVSLDLSNNQITSISNEITLLRKLKYLYAKNNRLENEGLPKDLGAMSSLRVLNINGNGIGHFPPQLFEMPHLEQLFMGGNRLNAIPKEVENMLSLEVLALPGNCLVEIPAEVGHLSKLTSLNLCSNRLRALPSSFIRLHNLVSLSLHNNNLSTLPSVVVSLNLMELSLRNNPLVDRFVQDMIFEPPSLLELSGRVIKSRDIPYHRDNLPHTLLEYLSQARSCVNPKCKGVFFTSKVEHVKFVDFCGKYRVPLMQYLCSPTCTPTSPSYAAGISSDSESDTELKEAKERLKLVLLG